MRRVLITLIVACALSACGFHPRQQIKLSEAIGPMKVETSDPYSPLGIELASALSRSGAEAPADGSASASLKIIGETWTTTPLSLDQFAQVREYLTRYRVDFAMQSADGKPLIEPQSIELSREYTYDANASAGSPAEQELIQRELRRDMQAAILRRIDIVLRNKH
ncbi:MAG TPA: LPS assembly lipoprotein LptE [Arenimonas sp.]|uniref:LPS-assembly lipoprotein LptE n=1 Tax=Arenimonas sp. TaxID=1872635 RepID=UPI002D1215B5|nr:LPS assembly lipoprotein LptE [Arenimonas sp.]HMB55847.1 LPS assembly lipoprotein LptE [Arenimonas sp.]